MLRHSDLSQGRSLQIVSNNDVKDTSDSAGTNVGLEIEHYESGDEGGTTSCSENRRHTDGGQIKGNTGTGLNT